MATYGEGDPTDNAQDFYDWLQENDDEDLSGLNYTVSLRPRSVSHSTQEEERPKALGVDGILRILYSLLISVVIEY